MMKGIIQVQVQEKAQEEAAMAVAVRLASESIMS